ncbi:AAA family ATPase [Lapillicoccus jejuensis]|uniref:NadR type nicotinamide-nucleotide adenylyltransferase n=1 Tax=Lapillicoccus jejuensis TaxID=402171 RepID=A0A542E6T7_9MICO|nr:AAA family ATPase [Lapillicoccus jejuensis]TQJ11055.1 NadR type nicotinamide-nucleotide adenylyltransferase [Lapillicoccus jejuensis]
MSDSLDRRATVSAPAPSHVAGKGGRRFRHGLVIGTFYPPHVGHLALVRAALSRCDRVTVEVLGGSTESIPVPLRVQWLVEEAPTARVTSVVDDAEIDFESAAAWEHHTGVIRSLLDPADGPVGAVFTSDAYGEELAHRLDAEWVRVDPERSSLTVSSTAVRRDVPGHWWALPAAARAHLAKRVVVLGAESSGTTTLASDLADRYGVPWVPEYVRAWAVARPGGPGAPWQDVELDLVAQAQAAGEDAAARRTPRPLLLCDTDVLAAAVWHQRHVGSRSPRLEALAAQRVPDLYLLTSPDDVPLPRGAGADGERRRAAMHEGFRQVLAARPARWVEVAGDREERLARATQEVDALLARGWDLAPSLEQQQHAARRHGAT